MNTTPSYIAAFLLSLPGLAVYFLNPRRSTTLAGGFVLQLIFVALIFYFTIPQDIAINKFKRYAKEDSKENRQWLFAGLGIYLVCGVLILLGIKSGFLRFILFLIMWGSAIMTSEMVGFFVWHHFNKEWLAKEFEKDAAEAEKQEAKKLAAQRAAEQKKAAAEAKEKTAQQAAEREKAIAEEAKRRASSQPAQAPLSKSLPRIQATPDPRLLMMLKNGDVTGLQMALSSRTPEALAAIEETIALYSGNPNPSFYRLGGQRIYTEQSTQSAKEEILDLALNGNLLQDPAHSQSLVAGLGTNPGISELIMRQLSVLNNQALYDYQLLGVQMQLAHLLSKS